MSTEDSTSKSSYAKEYRKTPHGAAACAWNRLTSRAGNKYGHGQAYAHVEVRMTREQFMAWAVPEYERWFAERQNERPSVDRIHSEGHYELGNIQIIEWGANTRKRRGVVNLDAPEGTKWCPDCKAFLPLTAFYRQAPRRGNPLGASPYCKEHNKARQTAKRREKHGPVKDRTHGATPGVNCWCPDCCELRPVAEFYARPVTERKNGLSIYCKKHTYERSKKGQRERYKRWYYRNKAKLEAQRTGSGLFNAD